MARVAQAGDGVVRPATRRSQQERELTMQHVRIAQYQVASGTFEEVGALVQAPGGMLEVFHDAPGFIAYGLADAGDGTFVSLSLWETRAEAEAAVPTAAAWIRENVADRIKLTDNTVADFSFLAGGLVTA
jgi:heme-degrading monooxygenase HmoA